MWKVVVCGLAAVLLLAACAASTTSEQLATGAELPSITVYMSPT
jgi:uncharacterized lipoprotein YajG